ncbi:MAG: DUF819 family protein [Myxococcales bacterium]|nr:DUF819 family protein [Myxococcales bacterium]
MSIPATSAAVAPLITNDAVVFGLLVVTLGAIFLTESSDKPGWRRFYKVVPSLLVCYFLPSVFNSIGLISGEQSNLYFVASRYLLPASLVLLTLTIDLPGILRLGPKAIIMFLTGTIGVVIGGPLSILLISAVDPELVGGQGPDAVWRGMTTVAGSWIGGGANQAAMKEAFGVGDRLFSIMVTVDVIVANVWMAVLLGMAGRSDDIDNRIGADNTAIAALTHKMQDFQAQVAKVTSLTDLMAIAAVGFGITAIGHLGADWLAPWLKSGYAPGAELPFYTSGFFWLVVIATTGGLLLSFTPARNLEGAGASKVGSAFLYILVATIGMKMDITAVVSEWKLFVVGGVWISVHATLLLVVARLIRAPTFFLAVGSQANIGGAASAPIMAAAFHPALAPVGVMLAVLGYALGTYMAGLTGYLMQAVAP